MRATYPSGNHSGLPTSHHSVHGGQEPESSRAAGRKTDHLTPETVDLRRNPPSYIRAINTFLEMLFLKNTLVHNKPDPGNQQESTHVPLLRPVDATEKPAGTNSFRYLPAGKAKVILPARGYREMKNPGTGREKTRTAGTGAFKSRTTGEVQGKKGEITVSSCVKVRPLIR
jgi:hypothetical protein